MGVSLRQRFARLSRYNEWANAEMYNALGLLTDGARRRDVGSWFRSIHGILNHLIVCDINWLRRYRALSPRSPSLNHPALDPPGLSWDHDLHEDFARLAEHRRAVDALIRAWFDEVEEADLDRVFDYVDSSGGRRSAAACDAFDFLFVHQAHHRGEIAQILDTLGLPNSWADNTRFLEQATEGAE